MKRVQKCGRQRKCERSRRSPSQMNCLQHGGTKNRCSAHTLVQSLKPSLIKSCVCVSHSGVSLSRGASCTQKCQPQRKCMRLGSNEFTLRERAAAAHLKASPLDSHYLGCRPSSSGPRRKTALCLDRTTLT